MAESAKTLAHDHPDYEFPKEVHNLLVAAQGAHVQLSSMADSKASILMGATFLVFTLTIGQITSSPIGSALPLILLGGFSFAATVLSVLAVLPKISVRATGHTNILFFGAFSHLPEDKFIDAIMDILRNEEATYRAMARDLYQNGVVLQRKKYYYLTRAYQVFMVGLVVTVVVFVAQLIFGPLLAGFGYR